MDRTFLTLVLVTLVVIGIGMTLLTAVTESVRALAESYTATTAEEEKTSRFGIIADTISGILGGATAAL